MIPLLVVAVLATIFGLWLLIPYLIAISELDMFTLKPQGQILTVMRGAAVERFIAEIPGFEINGHKIVKMDVGSDGKWIPKHPVNKSLREELTGVAYVGIPPFASIHQYKFDWSKFARKEKGEDQQIVPKHELVGSVYFDYPYAIVLTGIETSAKAADAATGGRSGITKALKFGLQVRVRAYDLNKMLFPDAVWLTRLSSMLEEHLRNIIGGMTYEEVIEERHSDDLTGGIGGKLMVYLAGSEDMAKKVSKDEMSNEETDLLPSVIVAGVIVLGIDVRTVDIDGTEADKQKFLDSINAEATAEKAMRAKKKTAEGDAFAERTVGTAKAEVAKAMSEAEVAGTLATIAAYSAAPDGAAIALAEGLRHTGASTVVLGATGGVGLMLPSGDKPTTDRPQGFQPQPTMAPPTTPWRRPQKRSRQGQGGPSKPQQS